MRINFEKTIIEEKKTISDLPIKIKECSPVPYEKREGSKTLNDCVYKSGKDGEGPKRINYANTVDAIAGVNDIISVNRMLYSPDGAVSDMNMRKDISDSLILAGWTDVLDAPVTHILNSVKDRYHRDRLPVDKNVIPFANGDLHIKKGGWEFRKGEKKQCAYRLAVDYIPDDREMPWFNKWLNDIFVEEDIITIQEILGYCMLPITSAQEAFILVGEAETGKSVLTRLLCEMFGNAYQELSIKELAQNRFYTALIENRLVIYDDDLFTEAISETGIFKKIVTANQEITAERKFEQPHKFLPYCKIIANSNDMIKTLYDDSNGFYRRLHPLHVKDKDPNRETISNMAELVSAEKNYIARWALKGLVRVIQNGYNIYWSERSKSYMASEQSKGLHFPEFFENVFEQDENACITSERIARTYSTWCRQNAVQELSTRRLLNWISANAEKLNIERTRIGDKRTRGFSGIKLKEEWKETISL